MAEFKVSAPGKVILFGEHSVVYGKTAVAASLALRTNLDFKETLGKSTIEISMPKINLHREIVVQEIIDYFFSESSIALSSGHNEFYKYVQKFVEQISYETPSQKQGLEALFYLLIGISHKETLTIRAFYLNLDTELSIGSGLGSSASFAVCLATCFYHWSRLQKNLQTSLDDSQLREISSYALECERIMHGTPSGIDNTICTFGSIIEFRKGECLIPISGAKVMRVLVVDTRVSRNTKTLVESFAQLRAKYPKVINPLLESMDGIAKEALTVIRRIQELPEAHDELLLEAYNELMTLIKVNQGFLSTCNLSHPSLDVICAEAKNYGLAGKLTGAGGGGYAYILLLPSTPNEVIENLSQKLTASGYTVTLTNLGGSGIEIHK